MAQKKEARGTIATRLDSGAARDHAGYASPGRFIGSAIAAAAAAATAGATAAAAATAAVVAVGAAAVAAAA
jgi:hypothetical protein